MQFIIFSLMILLSSSLYAQSAKSALNEGITKFAEKDWEAAETAFQEALNHSPKDPNLLSNLALVQVEKGELMLAHALWRKALYYSPFYSPAKQGLSFLQGQGDFQVTESSKVATFIHNIYRSPPLYTYLVVWIFLFLCLHSLHKHLVARKLAKEEEANPPNFSIKLGLYTVALALSVFFAFNQYKDRNTNRGLSLSSAITKLGPSSESPNLFTLAPGDQVDILSQKNDWLQIRNSQDQRAWIEKGKIFIF